MGPSRSTCSTLTQLGLNHGTRIAQEYITCITTCSPICNSFWGFPTTIPDLNKRKPRITNTRPGTGWDQIMEPELPENTLPVSQPEATFVIFSWFLTINPDQKSITNANKKLQLGVLIQVGTKSWTPNGRRIHYPKPHL